MKELIAIQNELKVLKDTTKQGIQFNYRTCEQIFQEVKPLCKKHEVLLTVTDEAVLVGDRYYIRATATVKKGDAFEMSTGYAREPEKLMSMSYPQITGSCSSYARKLALGGLFALDDNHDPDSDNNKTDNPDTITPEQLILLEGFSKDYKTKDKQKYDFIVNCLEDQNMTEKNAQIAINRIKASKK